MIKRPEIFLKMYTQSTFEGTHTQEVKPSRKVLFILMICYFWYCLNII